MTTLLTATGRIHAFQTMPLQQQQKQQQQQQFRRPGLSQQQQEQERFRPSRSSLAFYTNDSNDNHHSERPTRTAVVGTRRIRQHCHLDMVSKFVQVDLSLGMYMEAGFYQLVASLQAQTRSVVMSLTTTSSSLPRTELLSQPQQRIHQMLGRLPKTRTRTTTTTTSVVQLGSHPLSISLIPTDHSIISNVWKSTTRHQSGIHFLHRETALTSKIAAMDYNCPTIMSPRPTGSNIQQQRQHMLKPIHPIASKSTIIPSSHKNMSLELIGDLSVKNPAFVNVLPTHSAGSTAAVATKLAGSSLQCSKSEDSDGTASSCTTTTSDRVWITSFSLTQRNGQIQSLDSATGKSRSVGIKTSQSMLWPNESNAVPTMLHGDSSSSATSSSANPATTYHDALLVSDGFLVPGKNSGGLYVVKNPTNRFKEETICLTGGVSSHENWFYHKSVWVDLTGDGRKSILTARAQMNRPFGNKTARTQLVWLEMPRPHAVISNVGGVDDDNKDDKNNNNNININDQMNRAPRSIAIEADGSVFDPFHARHLPWKTHVLDVGPDVMFAVADLDTTDDTVEVISSEFFDRKVSIRSIQKGPSPKVIFRRIIDDQCGAPFSAILADLDSSTSIKNHEPVHCINHDMVGKERRTTTTTTNSPQVVDSGSTVATIQCGDAFSHILVTSQPCKGKHASGEEGGALFAYRVPRHGDWKTEPWKRTTVASGFQVRTNLWNMINPGAPGFVYTFHPKEQPPQQSSCPARPEQQRKKERPMIAIAGDCSESAYLLQPVERQHTEVTLGDEMDHAGVEEIDASTCYKLVCEIETGATVGSIGIGYGSFGKSPAGIAKLYLPLFEKNKMLVFALSGDDMLKL